ncbi:MAG: GGDEF domain-containing protein [Nitrospirae bacterium]|nr:GGDEF domain-containing protein [Nitrospirota bacterium]
MSKPLSRLNIFRKLVLASIVVGLLPMILGFSLSYYSQRNTITETMGSTFQSLAHETGVKLGLLIQDLLDKAVGLAQSDRLVESAADADRKYEGMNPDQIRAFIDRASARSNSSVDIGAMNRRAADALEEFRRRDPKQYHLLVLTDREGTVVAASPPERATRYTYRGEIEWEAAFDGGKGKLFIGDITLDTILSAYTLNMAVPVHRDGKIAGVLLLIHTVDRLFKSVTDVRIGKTDHTMLAASDGSLLFCPIFQIKNHTLSKLLSQGIFKDQDGWSTTKNDVHYPGREAINGFAPVDLKIENLSARSLGEQRWYIFTSQNPTETYEPLRSLLRWTALSAGMGVLILVVLAVLVIRTIVRPITLFQAHAREILQGIQALPMDRQKPVAPYVLPRMDIQTGDEIEDLAGTFSEIVGALENSRRLLYETTRRLEEMAITDELTGLYNRRHVMEELKAEFSRSMRFGLPLSCLAIDLDFFKEVNDRYGHLAGDEALRQISDLFQKNFREPDILARSGGEEFLVILPQTDIQGALAKAELLRKQVEQQDFTVERGTTIHMTISIGAAAYPDERIHTMDHLLKTADDVLYRSKETGRNRVSRG